MDEKMTYKQALIRSLVMGGIFAVCTLLLVLARVLNFSHGPWILPWILELVIDGSGVWLIALCFSLERNYNLTLAISSINPIIVCALLGSIIFLLLKNKTWLTMKRFQLILLGGYVLFNIVAGVITIIILLATWPRLP